MGIKSVFLSVVGVLSLSIFFSCSNIEARFKEQYIKSCESEILKTFPEDVGENKAYARNYCNCNAEKLLENFKPEDIDVFLKRVEANEEEAVMKMIEITRPCIEDSQENELQLVD